MADKDTLGGMLQAEIKRLRPEQVTAFRQELQKTLPQAIKSAAEVARQTPGKEVNHGS